MKIAIPLLRKNNRKQYLRIERRYNSRITIIPIGCDCHPAYTLQKLNIRKYSLPFDWLNTEPARGLEFVTENIQSDFNYFLKNFRINNSGNLVAEKYPYAEFIHENKDNVDLSKLQRRINRFIRLRALDNILYLYNIPCESLQSAETVAKFCTSVMNFVALLKEGQLLCIYIRYDESATENKKNCDLLIENLKNVKNVTIAHYIREKQKYGIWGNTTKYVDLYRSLGIPIAQTIPKIYLK